MASSVDEEFTRIIDGPSREALFDSLKYAKQGLHEVTFVTPVGEVDALVIGLNHETMTKDSVPEDEGLDFLFIGEVTASSLGACDWITGTYNSRTRKGYFDTSDGRLPPPFLG